MLLQFLLIITCLCYCVTLFYDNKLCVLQEEVDAGAIIVQESVPVYPGDTIDMLAERIKTAEHVAFPAALEMVASERAKLGADGKLVWAW